LDFVLVCKNFKEFTRRTLLDIKLTSDTMDAMEKLRIKIRVKFDYIVSTYLVKDSVNFVSMSSHITSEILQHYNGNGIPPVGIFDAAEQEISGLLKNGSFRRFLQECSNVRNDFKDQLEDVTGMGAIEEESLGHGKKLALNAAAATSSSSLPSREDSPGPINPQLYKEFVNAFFLAKASQECNNINFALAPKYRMDPELGKMTWVSSEWFQAQILESRRKNKTGEESKSESAKPIPVELNKVPVN
jgi:hypothetical protein